MKVRKMHGVRFAQEDAVVVEPLPGEIYTTRCACPRCGHRHIDTPYAASCICGEMDRCLDCYRCCKCGYPMRKQIGKKTVPMSFKADKEDVNDGD